MKRTRKAVGASLIGRSQSEDRRGAKGLYECQGCGWELSQDSADPLINRWCANCKVITKQKWIPHSRPAASE